MRRALSVTVLAIACTQPKPEFSAPPPSPCSVPSDTAREPLAVGRSCSGSSGCTAAVLKASDAGAGCCESLWVPGGEVALGFAPDEIENITTPQRENVASVSGFFLDRFQVTLGRFLRFAEEYRGAPEEGAGAHPLIEGSGWQSEDWDRFLPATADGLLLAVSCGSPSDPLPQESSLAFTVVADAGVVLDGGLRSDLDLDLPMACLDWFTAFAFCAWDGGRLPTEAEWEYAAAGAVENRRFPWGDDVSIAEGIEADEPQRVGSRPLARGCFGHDDLVGGLREWTLDYFDVQLPAPTSCAEDCANLEPTGTGRALRGGDCCTGAGTAQFHSAARVIGAPGLPLPSIGVRCARD